MRTYLIYKATAPSGKVYIGLTCQSLKRRKYQHRIAAKNFQSSGSFQKALRKYNLNMVWEVLESGLPDFETAASRERFFILQFESNVSGKGYNHTEGGDQGRPKNSRGLLEHHPVRRSDGVVFPSARAASLAMGAKIEDAVGKALRNNGTCAGYRFEHISLEQYESLKDTHSLKGDESPIQWTMARTFSENVRQKISETKKGKPCGRTSEGEKVRVGYISKPVLRSDGVIFHSIKEAASAIGKTIGILTYAVKKNQPCEGFTFQILAKGVSVDTLSDSLIGQC